MEYKENCKYCNFPIDIVEHREDTGVVERHEHCEHCGYFYTMGYGAAHTNAQWYEDALKYRLFVALLPREKILTEGDGVSQPLFRVGCRVYFERIEHNPINNSTFHIIQSSEILEVIINKKDTFYHCQGGVFTADDVGKTIFLTRQEAETQIKSRFKEL